ncbi:hypothetical protein [uncultured Kordia sp.]|uniref:hypothetical protein n=1 Tax=uncultured Kordia sp. TaxID=507699 RepID=UPI002627CC17|nr:hypothetical protein [uncultured Kordia sp.]
MKTKIILFLLVGFLISCNNDDDATTPGNPISGTWKLIDVSCECAPPNFQADHIWNFDLSQNKLMVANEVDEPLQIFETGIYFFVLGSNTITLQDLPYEYFFENDRLHIGYQYQSDGPLMIFERQQ